MLDFILVLLYKKSLRFPTRGYFWVITRNAAGTVTVIGLVMAIKYLPLGLYQILYNTAPFWASIMSLILLGERLNAVEIIAMFASFFLVVMFAMTSPAPKPPVSTNNLTV